MFDNHSDCCAGLEYPRLPHLHAEKCPTRNEDFKGLVLFRESPEERASFDRSGKTFGTTQLVSAALQLDTWGRAQMGPHGYGSYSQHCFIMANECLKADQQISELQAKLAAAEKLLAMMPADLVDHQRDLLEQTGEL